MKLQTTLLALAVLPLAAASPTLAEDVRVTCTGTVSALQNGGVGTAPFAGAAVGEAVTLVVDVEIANQLPFGLSLGALNWPSSSLSIGGASDGVRFTSGQQVSLGDNAAWYGDYLHLASFLATDASTEFELFFSDVTGQLWATRDWAALVGTSVQATGLATMFRVQSPQGWIEVDLALVTFAAAPGGALGVAYCTAAPNSTGVPGLLGAHGLGTPAYNDLTLVASQLPTQTTGYFLVGAAQGFQPNVGGSAGNLCLSGPIGRFVGPGQVKATDFGGEIALPVDLTELPSPTGALVVQMGQTWFFQLWHRDQGPSGPTSNFTPGLAVTFQ